MPTEKRKQTESVNVFTLPALIINRCNKMDYHCFSETLFIFFGCLGKSEPMDLFCQKSDDEKKWQHLRPQLVRIHNFSLSAHSLPLPSPWSSSWRETLANDQSCVLLKARDGTLALGCGPGKAERESPESGTDASSAYII